MVKRIKKKSLPISQAKEKLMRCLTESQVSIIVGETGSGKTTQVAQYIYDHNLHGGKRIGITQPRRVAAISVAKRVSWERSSTLGSLVGYSVRFDSKVSANTRLKYMTDGMLLRECMLDSSLSEYSYIIVDEAHERSINTDILLGILHSLIKKRPDLRIVIMSATIEAEQFQEYFDTKAYISIKGRNFEVETLHAVQPEADYIDACVVAIIQVHLDYPLGDILVFMTGQEEIEDVQNILAKKRALLPSSAYDYSVLCLYSALPSSRQLSVFEPVSPNTRKIILATNIAETSLTIEGIRYVIDSGMVKERRYNPRSGMDALQVVRVSKAAALQRAGRAGRTQNGKCFRLYTRGEFLEFEEHSSPEIIRSNLSSAVLQLKIMGEDPRVFPFMNRPEVLMLESALRTLRTLGALNASEDITLVGRKMAELPLEPPLARVLLASLEPDLAATEQILTIVALMCVENLCFYRKDQKNAKAVFKCPEGDLVTLERVYTEWKKNKSHEWAQAHGLNFMALNRAKMIRKQLKGYLAKYQPLYERKDNGVVLKCLAKGLFRNCAVLQADGLNYRTLTENELVYVHPTSVLFSGRKKPKCVIFSEVVVTTKKYIREISEADLNYIQSLSSN